MTSNIVLKIEGVTKHFGGVYALTDVSFDVMSGHVQAIIGPNGAGKTTLLNVISGINQPNAGRVVLEGKDVTGLPSNKLAEAGVARTFQTPQIFQHMTALENVVVGSHLFTDRNLLTSILNMSSFRQNEAERFRSAKQFMIDVGLEHRIDDHVAQMPYGELKRLEVARALALRPKLLLLDEPAAGLNHSESRQIGAIIRGLPSKGVTPILIEHDMKLVMNISDRVQVLESGRTLSNGTPDEVRSDPKVIDAYLGAPDESELSLNVEGAG